MISFTLYKQVDVECKWCDKSVTLIHSYGLECDVRPLTREKLLVWAEKAHMKTVPIIYHGMRLVGGFDQLESNIRGQRWPVNRR